MFLWRSKENIDTFQQKKLLIWCYEPVFDSLTLVITSLNLVKLLDIDHEVISVISLCLPLIQEGHLLVTSICTKHSLTT